MLCRERCHVPMIPRFKSEKAILDCVRVNVAVNVDLGLVLDGFVLLSQRESFKSGRIGFKFVGHNHFYIGTHVLFDELCQCARFASCAWKNRRSPPRCRMPITICLVAFSESRFALMAALDCRPHRFRLLR